MEVKKEVKQWYNQPKVILRMKQVKVMLLEVWLLLKKKNLHHSGNLLHKLPLQLVVATVDMKMHPKMILIKQFKVARHHLKVIWQHFKNWKKKIGDYKKK